MFSFFKPRWQHKNPTIRIEAINMLPDNDELLTVIVRDDRDQKVQIQALKKINNISICYSLYQSEYSSELKQIILLQLLELLAGTHPKSPSLGSRMEYITKSNYQKLPLDHVVMTTQDILLAQNALVHIVDPQNLLKIAMSQSIVREDALLKISDISVLEQLIKNNSNKDKKNLKTLKSRLAEMRAKKEKEALKIFLIQEITRIAHTTPLPPLNQFSVLENRWKQEKFDTNLEKEVASSHYIERLSAAQTLRAQQQNKQNKQKNELTQTNSDASKNSGFNKNQPDNITQSPVQLIESSESTTESNITQESTLPNSIDTTQSNLFKNDAEIEVGIEVETDISLSFNLEHISNLLKEIQSLLNIGKKNNAKLISHAAQNYLKLFNNTKNNSDEKIQDANLKLSSLRSKINELDEMEAWAITQSKIQLCIDAENLQNTNLPAEMLLEKLKMLRVSWKSLKANSTSSSQELWLRFNSTCTNIFTEIKNLHREQTIIRKNHITEANLLLSNLNELVIKIYGDSPNWMQLDKTRSKFLSYWREYLIQRDQNNENIFSQLDQKKLEHKMRKTLTPLTEKLMDIRNAEGVRRDELIQFLEKNINELPIDKMTMLAKKAQKSWSPILPLNHKSEEILWQRFKSICDQVFEKRNTDEKLHQLSFEKNKQKKLELIEEIKMIHAQCVSMHVDQTSIDSIDSIIAQSNKINTYWQAIEHSDAPEILTLNQTFLRCIDDIKQIDSKINNAKFIHDKKFLKNVITNIQLLESKVSCLNINHPNSIEYEMEIMNLQKEAELLDQNKKQSILNRINTVKNIINEIHNGQDGLQKALKDKIQNNHTLAKRLCTLQEITSGHQSPPEDSALRIELQIEILNKSLNHHSYQQENTAGDVSDVWEETIFGVIDDALMQRYFKI